MCLCVCVWGGGGGGSVSVYHCFSVSVFLMSGNSVEFVSFSHCVSCLLFVLLSFFMVLAMFCCMQWNLHLLSSSNFRECRCGKAKKAV